MFIKNHHLHMRSRGKRGNERESKGGDTCSFHKSRFLHFFLLPSFFFLFSECRSYIPTLLSQTCIYHPQPCSSSWYSWHVVHKRWIFNLSHINPFWHVLECSVFSLFHIHICFLSMMIILCLSCAHLLLHVCPTFC